MAELVKFQQKTDSEIDATPITDGLLMFSTTTGSGRIAMDYAGARNTMGGTEITVDSVLSLVSENPVQNKVITEEIGNINDDITAVENTYTQSFPSCETYSPTGTYAINDYVIYSSALYRCIVAITVGEAWNSAHWTSINSTNIGLIYNTTDSSFYGRSGADSVLKKLASVLTRTLVGSYSISNTSYTIDMSSLPNGLTTDNFYVIVTYSITSWNESTGTNSESVSPSYSYNSSTKILTLSDYGEIHSSSSVATIVNVYCTYLS